MISFDLVLVSELKSDHRKRVDLWLFHLCNQIWCSGSLRQRAPEAADLRDEDPKRNER